MGGALGLRAARCESFGRGLSGAAREQPATVGVGPARTVGGVLWGPRGTRAANGRGVRPLGSGTRLEPSSADRPHLGWAYVVVAVWLPTPRRAHSVACRTQEIVAAKRMGSFRPDLSFIRIGYINVRVFDHWHIEPELLDQGLDRDRARLPSGSCREESIERAS